MCIRFRRNAEDCSSHIPHRPVPWRPGILFPEKADHLLLSTIEIKNVWSYISTPPTHSRRGAESIGIGLFILYNSMFSRAS
jgi:hypothetical protein